MPHAVPQPAAESPIAPRTNRFVSPAKAAVATLLGVVAMGAGAIPWWLSSPERLGRIVARAVPELDGDVTFERVRLGWTGPIVLEGVRVVPRGGDRPPIEIGRIEGSHGLLAMLLSAGDLGRLTIRDLAVDVVFDEEHGTNLERLVRVLPPDPAVAPPRPKRSAVRMRLAFDDAVVRITAPWTAEPWVSEPIDVAASLVPVADGWSEWRVDPVELIADARMEPPVAWGVLAYAAPVLANTTRTSGRFSIALDGARLPVGDPAAGTLSGTLAMHEVTVGPGPMIERFVQSLPGGLPAPPTIRIAEESHVRFRLADRRVWHEGLAFGVPLPGEGRRLDVRSSGSVGLEDRSLDVKLVLPIPADLRQDRPLLAALAGKTISMGVAGNLGEPRVVFDGSIGRVAAQVARELLERAQDRTPAAPEAEGTKQSDEAAAEEALGEILGGVIEGIGRRRAERRAAEEAGEPPPRRRRILQRSLRPLGPPGPPPAAAPDPTRER